MTRRDPERNRHFVARAAYTYSSPLEGSDVTETCILLLPGTNRPRAWWPTQHHRWTQIWHRFVLASVEYFLHMLLLFASIDVSESCDLLAIKSWGMYRSALIKHSSVKVSSLKKWRHPRGTCGEFLGVTGELASSGIRASIVIRRSSLGLCPFTKTCIEFGKFRGSIRYLFREWL